MRLFKLIYCRECQGYVAVQWLEYNHCNVSIDHNLSNFCLNCESVVQTTQTKIVLKKIGSPGLKISPKCVCGYAPDPTGGVYSAPLDPLAWFRGPLRGGRREWGKEWIGRESDLPSSFMLIPSVCNQSLQQHILVGLRVKRTEFHFGWFSAWSACLLG